MQIFDLHILTLTQIGDHLGLVRELGPKNPVTAEMTERAAKAPKTHLFAALSADGQHIIGLRSSASLTSLPAGKRTSRMSWGNRFPGSRNREVAVLQHDRVRKPVFQIL